MTSEIKQPQLLSLDALLKDRLFEIPKFQRPYSWKFNQRNDLFSDIDLLLKDKKKSHFMATVVCLEMGKKEKDGTDELSRMQIVDGQQRITTLVLLLKTIQLYLAKSPNKKDLAEAQKLQKLLVRGKKLVLLQTNHQSARIFREYLISGIIPDVSEQKTIAERYVAEGISDCIKYVEQNSSEVGVIELLATIKNRLNFIFYVLADEKVVYTVFEVLNSRGLAVSSLDKCKSMLMGIVYEKYSKVSDRKEVIEALHVVWESIYLAIGTHKVVDAEILRFAATLASPQSMSIGKNISEEEALQFFADTAKAETRDQDLPECLLDTNEDICVLLSIVIKNVATKLVCFDSYVRRSGDVTDILQARLLMTAIQMSEYSDEEKVKLSLLWEKITVRIYGLYNKDSRSKVGDYVRLARKIFSGCPYDEAYSRLEEIGIDYPVSGAVQELCGKPWYPDLSNLVRYVLYCYEEKLASDAGETIGDVVWGKIWNDSASKTIEHIYPKSMSAELQKNWPNKKVNSQDDLNKFVHNIGNLTLLPPGLNSSVGQKQFSEKKKEYVSQGLKITKSILQKNSWKETDIKERENEILAFILEEWK